MPTITKPVAALLYLLIATALLAQVISATTEVNGATGSTADPAAVISAACAQLMSSATDGGASTEEKLLLCQLYESSSLLAQLGALVSEGLDRLMLSQVSNGELREKRKHEYLRFGKRKHEYLRFGKRKHEYLRFG